MGLAAPGDRAPLWAGRLPSLTILIASSCLSFSLARYSKYILNHLRFLGQFLIMQNLESIDTFHVYFSGAAWHALAIVATEFLSDTNLPI